MAEKRFLRFMELLRGTWRNGIWLECDACGCGQHCGPLLLTVDADGSPVIFPIATIAQETGAVIDKSECAGVMERPVLEALFHRWLIWHTSDPNACSIRQIMDAP